MAKIAYIRVSSDSQSYDRQEMLLGEIGIDIYFREKISGKEDDRPEFVKMMNFVRKDDVLYIESISRLNRSLQGMLKTISKLQEKGVSIVSLKEPFLDTTTPAGTLIFQIFSALSEFERSQLRLRQAEGQKARRAKGLNMGRMKIEVAYNDVFQKNYLRWKSGEISTKAFMSLLELKSNTFYRRIKEYEDKQKSLS